MKLNSKRTLLVGLAFMSICAFWQIYDNIVPLILTNTFGWSNASAGLIMGLDNILALVLLPFFGAMSDRTNTKIGRRMPYILIGTAIVSICLIIMPIADNNINLMMFLVTLGVVLLAMSLYRSPAVALMPDITPKPLRSKGNAIINLTGAVGGALVLVLTPLLVAEADKPNYEKLFAALAVFMVACIIILFFTVKEPKAVAEMRTISAEAGIDEETDDGVDETGARVKMEPAVAKSFVLILVSVFLWFMGYNAVTSTFTRYAQDIWGIQVGDASMILLVANAAAIISYIPVGLIATKFGRKNTILGGLIMLASAFAMALLFKTFTPLIFVFFSLAGIGWAFINVNSYPMVVDMSKGPNIGRYTGYYYMFSMSAQAVTPYLSGLLIDNTRFGFMALFPYGCVFVLLSFITMSFVKHGDSRPEKTNTMLEAFDVDD